MKKLILISTICLALSACGGPDATAQTTPRKDCIEVLYFHGKQRCATCNAIEKQTKEVLESKFAAQLKEGAVVFRSIDISKRENEPITDRYEVTWSSLYINKWNGGNETPGNFTEFAFANARTNPEKFKAELIQKIGQLLK